MSTRSPAWTALQWPAWTRPTLIWLTLLAAVVSSSVLVWQLRPQPEPPKEVPQRSDYLLRNFEVVMLNDLGHESFTVTGPYLERAPDGQSITLTEPRFSFPDRHSGRWLGQARRAWVTRKADEVRLLEGVEFLGPESDQRGQISFRTERLDVFPKAHLARSDLEVTATQGDSILTGTAFKADLIAQRYQLSHTKGRYAPFRP